MAVLITGGAGYIGSHTCVELLNAGREIVVIDNFCNSSPTVLDKIKKISKRDFPFYKVDLLDRAAVTRIFTQQPIDSVIHFASLKAVGESISIPLQYYQNNIAGTLILCEEMEKFGCKRMVFSSSATVYGMQNTAPFREDAPLSATNPYGYTKLFIEQILTDLHSSDPSWSIALLRYFNPIGAHESGLIGEQPNGIPNNLFPYIMQVAAGQLQQLSIYGDDYDTPDGTGVRDYIHVVDLSVGHLKALEFLEKRTGVEAINLGSGVGCSVLQLVAAFEKASGVTIPYQISPRRPGDIASCWADPSKAKRLLDWQSVRSVGDMCADGWNYIKNN